MKLNLLVLTLSLIVEAGGQPATKEKSEFGRWLTPEKCMLSYPDELYVKRLQTDSSARDSEQARDRFHEAYAEVLANSINKKFPDAAEFRKPLLAAFEQTFEFIRTANGRTSTAHLMTRLPAELEWDIYRGFETKFDNGISGEYTFDDIRNLARVYQNSQRRFSFATDEILKEILDPALEHLKAAEKSMSKDAIIYFRAKLVSMFVQFLAR